MRKLNNIKPKLYYRFLNVLLTKNVYPLPLEMQSTKNLFIYFDYEREFGGHETDVTDKQIAELLSLLDYYQIKSTWFTVGQIFRQYPESIREIVDRGHELSSHTFYHKAPYHYKKKELKKDFELVNLNTPIKIKGFHSPNGKWSFSLLKLLSHYNYEYDVLSAKNQGQLKPFHYTWPGINNTIRLYTVGDDWGLYQKKVNSDEAFEYFKRLYNQVKAGDVTGIGVHPWVLYSDRNLLKGFQRFLSFLKAQPDMQIKPVMNYIQNIKQNKHD